MLIFVEGGKPENPEKNPRSRDENQQQTQPTCDAGSRNRTQATAVGGECSHHCATPAPLVRQGDPLSPLLFILAIEILATQIRQDDNIHGVMVKNEEIKLTLFADDMTCFLNDINSYLQLCRLLEDFYKYSCLRINNDKTELFAIGSIKLAQHNFIHNVRTSIKILGTFLTTINRHGTTQILNQFSSPFKGPSICGSGEASLYLERFK